METQQDVSSRELVNAMTKLKLEANMTGLEFVALANKLKDAHLKLLKQMASERDNKRIYN